MKAVVLAYQNIGCAGIQALIRNGFEISAVFTHKDDAKENIWFDSTAELASALSIPVFAPEDINHPIWAQKIKEMNPDILFSFYYRQMVRKPILEIPPSGCLNLHGSLLPKYRGRAPINWVLINGEQETGVTLHDMTPRPDDGDIVSQKKVLITPDDTAKSLNEKMTRAAAEMLDDILPRIKAGHAPRRTQDHSKATYYGGRRPEDGEIIWSKTAREVRNLVRAVTRPYPHAFSYASGRKCFFWQLTETVENGDPVKPGTIINTDPLIIACGQGAVQVEFSQV